MLIAEDILNKMKTHFPRWMDIRRKIKSSIGGAFLSSISEEMAEIQKAIDDYKKDFFIDNYTGTESKILCFLYKVPVGRVNNIKQLTLINPEYKITDNEDLFYDNDDYVYYNDGNLYFKNPEDNILYSIDSHQSEGTYERIHVWNIYDEFAVFVGLRRFENETNDQLLKRIYAFSKDRANSSHDGLQHAIFSNFTTLVPELKKEDIIIERPTPENLIKYYNQFETILDHLSSINKDVYKEKQWDVDTWNFALKSIDYIPHAWDVALSSYLNGIGFKDDLKVEIIDTNPTTDVTIYFYQKTLDSLNDYIKNHNIKNSFNLQLKKYKDNLIAENVRYRITASDSIEINPNDIHFSSIEEKVGKTEVNLQDIIKDDSTLNIIDHSILSNDFNYEIDFIPTNNFGDFKINYCKQINNNNEYINLLDKNYSNFVSIGDGVKSTSVKKYIQELSQLNNYDNIKKSIYGFEVLDLSKLGTLSFNIDGLNGFNLYYDYDIKKTIYDLSNFNLDNCYIYNNEIISDTVDGDKIITTSLIANNFSCDIEGPFSLSYKINNNEIVNIDKTENDLYEFNIDTTNKPKTIELTIKFLDSNCRVKNCRYSRFDLELTTDKGGLISRNNYYIIPNHDINNLICSIQVYEGFSPNIKYFYIGSRLNESNGYYGIKFNPDNGTKLYTKYNNCRLQLRKYTKDTNELIETIYDYKPYKEYSAINDSKIELNLDNYIIDHIDALNCSISKEVVNNIKTIYYLTIPKNRSIISLDIYGKYINSIVDQSLTAILNNKGFSIKDNNKFFITKNEDAIIIKDKDNKLHYIKVYYNDIFNELSSSKLFIEIKNKDIISKFIDNNRIIYGDSLDTSFSFISFEPTNSKIYYAINEYKVYSNLTTNIEIVNTFNNDFNINSNNHYFYTIESLTDNYNVLFNNNDNKCLDKESIIIKSIDNTLIAYNYDIVNLNIELPLSSSVKLPNKIYQDNNEYDLREYILAINNKINYSNKYIDSNHKLDYIFTEEVLVKDSKINKLKYCNINEIENITNEGIELEENKDYSLIKDKGIIIFKNVLIGSKVIITYNINVPISFDIELDDLYEQINYPINSLKLLSTEVLYGQKNNSSIDLNTFKNFKESDLVSIKCSTPGFISIIKNDILTISNTINKNTIAVKTGYYYLNGKEYYLASDDKYDSVNKIDSINLHNVIKDNNSYILKIKSQNFITNSSFDLDTKGDIYYLDCKDKEPNVSSLLNCISTCDNFNYWETISSDISIIENGYNGQALQFTNKNNLNGYCYLPLNQLLIANKKYKLSFYLKGDCKAFLGKEKELDKDMEFNYQNIIEIKNEIKLSGILNDIYETEFNYNNEQDKYYLILEGTGIIDDIIITDEDNYDIYNHIKNIDKLNLNIQETIYPEYKTRLYLSDRNGAIFDGTEMNEDNLVFNSSYIKWGYTNIKSFNSYIDFNSCILDNVDLIQDGNSGIIRTGENGGTITTQPFNIGDINIINNLMYKLNDISYNDMKDINISILTSANKTFGYKEIYKSKNNTGIIDKSKLLPYIKIILDIPANKVIYNIDIYVEYLSNENNAPYPMEVTNGSYLTKILDAQYKDRFLLTKLNISDLNNSLNNYVFQIRATKLNNNKTIWTDWKTIELDEEYNIKNRITFIDYRYFQVRVLLKGENTALKINNIELEVI